MNKKNVLRHLHSFAKTYVTVFLALYLAFFNGQAEGAEISLLDWPLIISSAKWAFIAVLRNIYKLLMD